VPELALHPTPIPNPPPTLYSLPSDSSPALPMLPPATFWGSVKSCGPPIIDPAVWEDFLPSERSSSCLPRNLSTRPQLRKTRGVPGPDDSLRRYGNCLPRTESLTQTGSVAKTRKVCGRRATPFIPSGR
jgi:hypothetical protein